jgi:hypothetical protein
MVKPPRIEDIQTTVQVDVEVTVLRSFTITVDKSDPRWRERAVREAEDKASNHTGMSDVVGVRGEITDE